jgi:hypothetical protein
MTDGKMRVYQIVYKSKGRFTETFNVLSSTINEAIEKSDSLGTPGFPGEIVSIKLLTLVDHI